jgi:hypothetical protein
VESGWCGVRQRCLAPRGCCYGLPQALPEASSGASPSQASPDATTRAIVDTTAAAATVGMAVRADATMRAVVPHSAEPTSCPTTVQLIRGKKLGRRRPRRRNRWTSRWTDWRVRNGLCFALSRKEIRMTWVTRRGGTRERACERSLSRSQAY